MIAHYRKSRDKFSRAVAREATELLGDSEAVVGKLGS